MWPVQVGLVCDSVGGFRVSFLLCIFTLGGRDGFYGWLAKYLLLGEIRGGGGIVSVLPGLVHFDCVIPLLV